VTETTHIYARVGDAFREILDIETAEDNGGSGLPQRTSWSSEIVVVQGPTGFFDLKVRRNGVRDDKHISEMTYLKFDGQKYAESTLYH
jgi:hypothetical protein